MNIPEKVKVGGMTYDVHITDNLKNGTLNASAEIDFDSCEIRISNNARCRMESDFIHELVHAVWDQRGITYHDEKEIDEVAKILYAVIQDNPGIFKQDGDADG